MGSEGICPLKSTNLGTGIEVLIWHNGDMTEDTAQAGKTAMHILEFLSTKPLTASFIQAPSTMGEVMQMPKEAMIELSSQQSAQMLKVSQALAADVLTDGVQHFMLIGGFACRVSVEARFSDQNRWQG